jgi:hypothetical protein
MILFHQKQYRNFKHFYIYYVQKHLQSDFLKQYHTTGLWNYSKKTVRTFYYQIDYTEHKKLLRNTVYFCAQYHQVFPEATGHNYLIADIEGQGHNIGTVMYVRSRSPYWFGEGDAKFYVDGEFEPSNWGTGTEDYFLCAWGLNKCLFPHFGFTYMSGGEEDLGAKYTLYRWNIQDLIRFTKSLRFEIEHTGWMTIDFEAAPPG